jgi:hypothetical protein
MGLGFSNTSSSGSGVACDSDRVRDSGTGVLSWTSVGSGVFSLIATGESIVAGASPGALAFLFFFWVFDKGVGGGAPGTIR